MHINHGTLKHTQAVCFVFDGEVLVVFPDQAFDVKVYPGGGCLSFLLS